MTRRPPRRRWSFWPANSRRPARRTSACRCCWRWRTAWRAPTHGAPSISRRKPRSLAATLDDLPARAEALYLQGRCADLLLDHDDRARRVRGALRAFEAAEDDQAVAKTLRAISFVHDTLGNFPRALDYQFRALELDERTGNESNRAATLRTIGIVYSRSGDPAAGLDFYRKSLALCTRPDDAIERGKTLNNIGINLKNLGQLRRSAHGAAPRPTACSSTWACRCSSRPRSTISDWCRSAWATPTARSARCARRSTCPSRPATAMASRTPACRSAGSA